MSKYVISPTILRPCRSVDSLQLPTRFEIILESCFEPVVFGTNRFGAIVLKSAQREPAVCRFSVQRQSDESFIAADAHRNSSPLFPDMPLAQRFPKDSPDWKKVLAKISEKLIEQKKKTK